MPKFLCNPTSNSRVTSPYGWRYNHTEFHTGVDYGAVQAGVQGDPLYAVWNNGTVVFSKINSGGVSNGYGYYIVVEYKVNGEYYGVLYGHLKKLEVKVGDKVKAGQVIAHMGNTGTSTAAHLHCEIRKGRGANFFSNNHFDYKSFLVSNAEHKAFIDSLKKPKKDPDPKPEPKPTPKPKVDYFKKCDKKYESIVDALNSIKVKSDFSYRTKIAKANKFTNPYSGSPKQNEKMLDLLKKGKLIKP